MADYTSSYTGEELDTYVTKQQVVDLLYPIGAVYQTTANVHPNSLFGGAWIRLEGRFLLGTGPFGSNTNTTYGSIHYPTKPINFTLDGKGGEDTHKLTVSEMPTHYHAIYGFAFDEKSINFYLVMQSDGNLVLYKKNANVVTPVWYSNTSGNTGNYACSHLTIYGAVDGYTGYTGLSTPHNNMPPYKVVYMWKRVG